MLRRQQVLSCCFFFFFNDTATTEIYTLSLHDALPISCRARVAERVVVALAVEDLDRPPLFLGVLLLVGDRKSTRLNSSHANISYAVFCLKKKKPKHPMLVFPLLLLNHTLFSL